MSKATNSLESLGEKRSARKINLSVGAATKELEAWQSWESNDRTTVSTCTAIRELLSLGAKRSVTD